MKVRPLHIRVKLFGLPIRITIGAEHLVDALSQLARQLPQRQQAVVMALLEILLLEE